MKINTGIVAEKETKKESRVFIAPILKREREMFDINGNLIDPKTKQIIKRAGEL
jgi:hypothetical protein